MSINQLIRRSEVVLISLMLTLWFVMFPVSSRGADTMASSGQTPEQIHVVSGKSMVLKSTEPVKRVSIANPEVADFILISPQEIYITGKSAGVTTLMLWKDSQVSSVYDLLVTYDISRLKQEIHRILPGERDLLVLSTHDSVTLSGRVSSTNSLSKAMALARAYAPKGKVQDLVQVGGVHQVMLEVRVAEMQRNTIKRFGFNLSYNNGNQFGITRLGEVTQIVKPIDANIESGGPYGLFVTPAVNAMFRFHNWGATWTGFIDALREDGLAKVLAEPTLIALSGQSASFLAGGEFPVPVPQGLGTVAIDYKEFGVRLSFMPTVLDQNKISLKVTPEVSELDFTTAVRLEGFVIPGLTTRRAETVIELGDGQSFAIAGLLRETVTDSLQKYPVLGDIPVLGALFRSRAFQKGETELVIIATPHIVKPLDMAKQTLPTDYYVEPNDQEIYLLGLMEGRDKSTIPGVKANLDGPFGHTMPKAQ